MHGSFLLQTGIVGLAGACGACVRYLASHIIAQKIHSLFPFATLLINVTGSFAIGLFYSVLAQGWLSPEWHVMLVTGFLGGYTTYSTMHWEGWVLMRDGLHWHALFYHGISVGAGLLAVLSGIFIGSWRLL